MTRRHRILYYDENETDENKKQINELDPLNELLTNELILVSREHDQKRLASPSHMNLFRLWYRINRHQIDNPSKAKQGKPSYPTPITYGTIREHVSPHAWGTTKPLMVPLHSTQNLDRSGGDPQPDPQTRAILAERARDPIQEAE